MEPSNQPLVEVTGSLRGIRTSAVKQAVRQALRRHGSDEWRVCVELCCDERMRDLNLRFRGVDESTDVLSFQAPRLPGNADLRCGDIAISVEFASRQAKERGVSLEHEVVALAIHGALHLAGLDDDSPANRENMIRAMNEVAVECGFDIDKEWASVGHAGEQGAAR